MERDKQVPAKVLDEATYLENQTGALSGAIEALGMFLAVVMGVAAVFTGTNAMLSALTARTSEVGILMALGFRPFAIFVAFEFEAMVIGLLGGGVGCLLAISLNGVETGTTNFSTFSEVAFAFRTTPWVLSIAVLFSMLLGLLGGAIPALRAAGMKPTEALRRV
jgi:ABC-type antimicrobial peptide transport system permease subunit